MQNPPNIRQSSAKRGEMKDLLVKAGAPFDAWQKRSFINNSEQSK